MVATDFVALPEAAASQLPTAQCCPEQAGRRCGMQAGIVETGGSRVLFLLCPQVNERSAPP